MPVATPTDPRRDLHSRLASLPESMVDEKKRKNVSSNSNNTHFRYSCKRSDRRSRESPECDSTAGRRGGGSLSSSSE